MQERDVPQIVIQRGGGVGPFLWGALVGAAVALWFAPKSGEETQREIREGARRLRRDAEEKLTGMRDQAEEAYERVRDDVETRLTSAKDELRQKKQQAEEALKIGRDTARRTRDDLERRVAESKESYKAEMDRLALEKSEAGSESEG